jgi:hypothetical protein
MPTVLASNKLKLHAPEGSVRLNQFKAYVPSFVIAPNNLRLRGAPARGIDEPDAFVQRKSGPYNGQTPRFTYVNGDAVGALPFGAVFPFDLEFHARDDSRVGTQFLPSFLKRLAGREDNGVYCGIGGHA